MAKAFLLDEKQQNYYRRRIIALEKAMIAAGVDKQFINESDIEKISEHLPKFFNPGSIEKKLGPILAGKRFSVMCEKKHGPSPREWTPGEKLKGNEFPLKGQLSLAYREWYYTKYSPDEKQPFNMQIMYPIEEGTPAYDLLESSSSWKTGENFSSPSESEVLQLQELLGLQEYPYIPLNEPYMLQLLDSVCYEIVQQGLGQKGTGTKLINPIAPAPKLFYNMPNSPASDLIMRVFEAGPNLEELPDRQKKVNRNKKIEVITSERSEQKRLVSLQDKSSIIEIEVGDVEKILKNNKAVKKFFALYLMKANEQAIKDGELVRDYIDISIHELIEIGFYSTPQSAKRGFLDSSDVLSTLMVRGYTKVKGNMIKSSEKENFLRVLFTGRDVVPRQNICRVYLNPHINWAFLAQYFSLLPRYYFKLSNRASDLLYYIFYRARQSIYPDNIKEIKSEETGEKITVLQFNIKFRSIHNRLNLPSEIKNREPGKTIRAPIEEAITEIEDEHHECYGNEDFHLEIVCDDNASITEFLDNGYLRVTLAGDYAESFIALHQKRTAQIEKAQKRKDKATEKAMEKVMERAVAKDLENKKI